MYSLPNLEPVHCSMTSSNCCFLTCIQISQEAGKVVWYSHLLKYFPQFVVIHTVQDFGTVNKAVKWSEVTSLSRARLFATPWTVAYKAPLAMEFSRQEYWSGLHFLLQGIFPTQGSNPGLPHYRQTLYRLSHQGCFSGILFLFPWPSGCWQFDLWFLCLF